MEDGAAVCRGGGQPRTFVVLPVRTGIVGRRSARLVNLVVASFGVGGDRDDRLLRLGLRSIRAAAAEGHGAGSREQGVRLPTPRSPLRTLRSPLRHSLLPARCSYGSTTQGRVAR